MAAGRLILASASPRRNELLRLITEDFTVIPAMSEERADKTLPPAERVEQLARQKAEEISEKYPEDIVIGADTTVFCDGAALGKPKDAADAKRMLLMLSGREHSVITAVAFAQKGQTVRAFSEETKVEFYPLSDEEIDGYIKSGEPMDKAGAYGIQEKGALLIEEIKGDYFNVVGLPLCRLGKLLKKEFGIDLL